MGRLPSVFVSHGSPMHALQAGAAGAAWAALGRRLPRPEALVVASAHWETNVPMLTGSAKPETIHDFFGFPAPLYELKYPAPGSAAVAQRAQA
ncbi:MAG TPA: dioxygenase, partial [Burkholderiales bacterium]|nr:dioxygenase [Burkholderiales bacterium]